MHQLIYSLEIPSATGVQQGDPLGPVLFSLAIHSLVKELLSTFNVWYLDDGTLGGSLQIVMADFNTILHQSSFLGGISTFRNGTGWDGTIPEIVTLLFYGMGHI